MADTNKVVFGLSEIHVGTYTVGESGVIMGTPYRLPGAVSLSLDPEGDETVFYADNVKYYTNRKDNGFSGTLEMARFTDEFRKQFLGFAETKDGGLAQVKGSTKPAVYIAFQGEGDAQQRRTILYNVTLGNISISHSTSEGQDTPATESLPITVVGDNATGIVQATYNQGDAGYATIFSNPAKPELKSVSG